MTTCSHTNINRFSYLTLATFDYLRRSYSLYIENVRAFCKTTYQAVKISYCQWPRDISNYKFYCLSSEQIDCAGVKIHLDSVTVFILPNSTLSNSERNWSNVPQLRSLEIPSMLYVHITIYSQGASHDLRSRSTMWINSY